LEAAAVPPGVPEAAAAAPQSAEAAAVLVVSAGCLSASAFPADLPLLNSLSRYRPKKPPQRHAQDFLSREGADEFIAKLRREVPDDELLPGHWALQRRID